MPLVLELERAYDAAKADPAFQARARRYYLEHYVGRPSPLYFAERLTAPLRRREDLSQARGAEPHRRAQDQQLRWARSCWPGAWASAASSPRPAPASTASPPPRSARCFGLPCVVYMGAIDIERQTPNVFRMKLLGAEVRPVHLRHRDAEGRDERGAARLGHQCRGHLLPHRHGRRPASLSGDGARLPVRDRRGGARADAARRKGGCRTRWSPASAAARTRSASSIPFLDEPGVAMIGVEAAGHGIETGKHAASLNGGAPGRAARQPHLSAAGRRRPDHRRAFDLGRPRLSRHRPRACLAARRRRVDYVAGHRRRGARRLPAADAGSKASSRRWNPRTPWPQVAEARADARPDGSSAGGQPVRPRRQGPRHRRARTGGGAHERRAHRRAASPRCTREGRAGLVTYLMRRSRRRDASRASSTGCRRPAPISIELGMPFSDPMADGPAIQAAACARSRPA